MKTLLPCLLACATFILPFASAEEKAPLPKLGIEGSIIRKTRPGGDGYDDQKQTLALSVKVTNKDLAQPLKGATADILIIGRDTRDTKKFKCLLREQTSFELAPQTVHEFTTGSISNEYDDKFTAKYGYKYKGWVVIVKTDQGIVTADGTFKAALKNPESLDSIQQDMVFDKELLKE